MTPPSYVPVDGLAERHVHDLQALYLREWWTKSRSLADVRRMLLNCDLVFGLCDPSDNRLVAFARVLTDGTFKALIFDVIVSPEVRGHGLGRQLMESVIRHPQLKDVKHLELYCLPDMVPFYEAFGFSTEVSGVQLMRRVTR